MPEPFLSILKQGLYLSAVFLARREGAEGEVQPSRDSSSEQVSEVLLSQPSLGGGACCREQNSSP